MLQFRQIQPDQNNQASSSTPLVSRMIPSTKSVPAGVGQATGVCAAAVILPCDCLTVLPIFALLPKLDPHYATSVVVSPILA